MTSAQQAQIFRVNGLQHVAYPGPAAGEYSTSRFWFSSFALGDLDAKWPLRLPMQWRELSSLSPNSFSFLKFNQTLGGREA